MMLFILKVLTYLNSLFNPILYFITSRDFRKAEYKLCKCMSHGRQDAPGMSSTVATEVSNNGTTNL